MNECEICGNEIEAGALSCRFCGSQQTMRRGPAARRERVRTINIKAGHPSVEEGLTRLESELLRARQAGVRIVRVIHGWGSGGKGGALRDACRQFLARKAGARQIATYVAGDDYSPASRTARDLMARCPELRNDERTDTRNPGITLVAL